MADQINPYAKLGQPITPSVEKKIPTGEDPYQQVQKLQAIEGARKQVAQEKAAQPAPQADWTKTISSGLQKGVLGIPGSIGDVTSLYSYIPSLAAKSASWVREKVGMPFTEEQKADLEKSAKLGGEAIRAKTPFTTEQFSEMAQPYAEKYIGVGPQYEPKTKGEKVVKAGLEYGIPSAVGGIEGLASRLATGIAGAGASEYVGQKLEGSPLEPYARVATGVFAPMALEKGIRAPWSKAIEGAFSPDTAAKRGLGYGLSDYEAESAALAHQMARSKKIAGAGEQMPQRMRLFSRNLLGTHYTAPEFADAVDQFGRQERDRVYTVARSVPAAQSMHPNLFANLPQTPVFEEAERQAVKNAANVPEWGIQPPQVIPGQPGGTYHGPNGLQNVPNQPPTIQPGNLSYYDQVKRELESIMDQASRSGDTTRFESARNARSKLIDVLDTTVPEYREARGVAADTFKAASAPEAGARFFTLSDDYDLNEFRKAFSSYNPQQQQAFRIGLMGRLEQELSSKNPTVITNKFLKNPQFLEKFNFAFGPEVAGQIRSKVLAENMMQQADKIRANLRSQQNIKKMNEGLKTTGLATAGAALAGDLATTQFVAQALSSLGVSPVAAAFAGTVGGVTLAGQLAMNAVERRVAGRMIDIIKSNDPKTFSQLNALIDKHPDVYPKMMAIMQATDQATKLAEEKTSPKKELPQEDVNQAYERLLKSGKIKPFGQADGGRIGRASGGRIDIDRGVRALMRAAENAKKNISQETESLLEQPDEHIAQTLNAAKQKI